jgi:hypothetical protein
MAIPHGIHIEQLFRDGDPGRIARSFQEDLRKMFTACATVTGMASDATLEPVASSGKALAIMTANAERAFVDALLPAPAVPSIVSPARKLFTWTEESADRDFYTCTVANDGRLKATVWLGERHGWCCTVHVMGVLQHEHDGHTLKSEAMVDGEVLLHKCIERLANPEPQDRAELRRRLAECWKRNGAT